MNDIDPWGLVAPRGAISAKPWDNILGPSDPCGPAFGVGLAYGISAFWDWLWSEKNPVDSNSPPNHPDFTPHKKKKKKQKIPWNKNRKGYPDNKGNYWEPVPDGHKGTHDPHWDVQHPDGSHTPVYP